MKQAKVAVKTRTGQIMEWVMPASWNRDQRAEYATWLGAELADVAEHHDWDWYEYDHARDGELLAINGACQCGFKFTAQCDVMLDRMMNEHLLEKGCAPLVSID